MSELPPDEPEIVVPEAQLAGVWANKADVSHSQHEFTLDFMRLDSTAPPPGRGILVARVSVSAALVVELMNTLDRTWQDYAKNVLPPEIHGNESAQAEDF